MWLRSLTNQLKRNDVVEGLLDSYKVNYKNPLYESMMNIIIDANKEMFEEVRDMCEPLEELMKDKIEERAEERARELAEERAKEVAKEVTQRVNDLNIVLAAKGRIDDIIKAAEDNEYQKKLFEEFGL